MTIDTIVAQATPPGRGGVGIVRASGPRVAEIAKQVLSKLPKPRHAWYTDFLAENGTVIDQGIAIYFSAPHSFTGEDVLELQGHGGQVVLDLLIQTMVRNGARLARPGEFSERAYLNNKLDLAQAEAVADLIDASSQQAARSALRSLQGEFSQAVNKLVSAITQLRMYIEAAIDFPEEEIDFLSDNKITDDLNRLLEQLSLIINNAHQGQLLRDGMTIVIAGKPNAGKSSLLNRLTGEDTAIVTDIPGTTRDVLRAPIQIDGMPLHITDTAGLRESDDVVEKVGIERAKQEMAKADRIILMVDASLDAQTENLMQYWPQWIGGKPDAKYITVIFNKIDTIKQQPELREVDGHTCIWLSAKTGQGLDLLTEHLKQCMGYDDVSEGSFSARRRHLNALAVTQQHLMTAIQQRQSGELMAEELRLCQQALGEITGEVRPDDLLGKIFASFCIGK